jgi:acylphosphatase
MTKTVQLIIAGRVQGVFFRKSTKEIAERLGVTGTVRNLITGEVEVLAQAETAVLEQFMDWCKQGPILARVDRVNVQELPDTTNSFSIFEII